MNTSVRVDGKDYKMLRSKNCSNNDKFNRAAKLLSKFGEISNKMDGYIKRGNGESLNARLALAVKMMMYTGIRIGNESSAEGYTTKPYEYSDKKPEFVQIYGLTTLKPEHCKKGTKYVSLNFLGKKHVDNTFKIEGLLAKQFKQVLRFAEDFETVFEISAYELTKFIKVHVGRQFSPKDFRTMRANMFAWEKFQEICSRELPTTKKERNAEIKEICLYVSDKLNNTPGVCKTSYIDCYLWEELEEKRIITHKRN